MKTIFKDPLCCCVGGLPFLNSCCLVHETTAVIKISRLLRPSLSYLWMWPAKNQKHSVPFSTIRRDQRTAITVRRVNSCMVNEKIINSVRHCESYSILIVTTPPRYQDGQVAIFISLNISTLQEAQRNCSFQTAWCEIFLGLGLPMSEVIGPSGSLNPPDSPSHSRWWRCSWRVVE